MERLEALKNYYETHNEDIRLESRHGMVEFLTTIHYIQKYLKQNMNILEIGAGTGKYSHYFARKGYNVDAIELITQNIEIFKKNTEACENISIQQGDAINLENIPSEKYDITLLLGPMYHLYTEDDKKSAIKEAIRVTKKDGIIFVSYCNNDMTVYDFGFLRGGFKNEYYKKFIGKSLEVLVETYSDGYLIGHLSNYGKVKFKGDESLLHNLVMVKLNDYINDEFMGELIKEEVQV